MSETRSKVSDHANGDGTTALATAVDNIRNEAELLLQPDRPIETDTSKQRVTAGTAVQANGTSFPAVAILPGADPKLQELLHYSPFLDLSSPMTPYEWFKFFVMVIAPASAWHAYPPGYLFRCRT